MVAAWIFTLAPATAAVVGAVAASFLKLGKETSSAIQHLAAGIVLAAATAELLPEVLKRQEIAPTLVGGGIGIALMLIVRKIGSWATGSTGLIATVGVDVFVDGLVLGIGFDAGARAGLLLTLALTAEVLFLGLALVGELGEAAMSKLVSVGAVAAIAVLLPLGALAAGPVASLSPAMIEAFYAFAIVALLYLVTEELLVEAHEGQDPAWATAMFFVGFLFIVAVEQATS